MWKLQLHFKKEAQTIHVVVGANLWDSLFDFLINNFPTHSIFVITDSQIVQLYREKAIRTLQKHPGFRDILVVPAGEKSKNRQQKAWLEDSLLSRKAGRDTVVIAMGGGVVGDLAGFVAATLHRGILLVHLPTSLLAQVDSSIGGKVGINHPVGKNLIGAFYQPRAVFSDIMFLKTLPEMEFLNGMAEVIKYALVLDQTLVQWLEDRVAKILQRDIRTLHRIVARCVQLKSKVVETDEKESGYRSVLNFGHTVGHAIERLSQYKIKHGFAVAAGMRVAAELSHRLLNYPRASVLRLENLLRHFKLDDVPLRQFSVEQIWEVIQTDKKSRQQSPRFTLLDASHSPKLFYPVRKEELSNVLATC